MGLGFLLCFGEGWELLVVVLFDWLVFEGMGGDGMSFKGLKILCTFCCSKVDNFSRLDYLRLVRLCFKANRLL